MTDNTGKLIIQQARQDVQQAAQTLLTDIQSYRDRSDISWLLSKEVELPNTVKDLVEKLTGVINSIASGTLVGDPLENIDNNAAILLEVTRTWATLRDALDQRNANQPFNIRWQLAVNELLPVEKPGNSLFEATVIGDRIVQEFYKIAHEKNLILLNSEEEVVTVLRDDRLHSEAFGEPTPFIVGPLWGYNQAWNLIAYAHETGHHIYHNVKGLNCELLVNVMLTLGANDRSRSDLSIWGSWLEEIFADLFCLLRVGPAAIHAGQRVALWLSTAPRQIQSPRDTISRVLLTSRDSGHPVPYLRISLGLEVLNLLKVSKPSVRDAKVQKRIQDLTDRWEDLAQHHTDVIISDKKENIASILATGQLVLNTILNTPLYALAGRSESVSTGPRSVIDVFYDDNRFLLDDDKLINNEETWHILANAEYTRDELNDETSLENLHHETVAHLKSVRSMPPFDHLAIPPELIEQIRHGNVVLLCGDGISTLEEGLPSGQQLAHELAQRSGQNEINGLTLPEVAQAYELELGHHSLIEFLTSRIDDPRFVPLPTHQLLAALPFKRIITTNWDNLLEEALHQVRKSFVKVVRDADVTFADDNQVLLVKLHGSIEQKDSIVILDDDYYSVLAKLPETSNLIRSYYATKTMLFLGYSLADDDFKRLYLEITRNLGRHKRRAYAVQLNPMQVTIKYWQEKNVEVIAADVTDFLTVLTAHFNLPELPAILSSAKETKDVAKELTIAREQTRFPQKDIKILFLASNPINTIPLRLDEEIRAIDQALRQSDFRDNFDLKQHWAVRIADLQGLLLRYKPEIVHFSGHGSMASEISLEDDLGKSHPVSVRSLGELFSVLKDNIRCVVLNACYSEKQAQAIAQYIDCVIGMSKAITDKSSIRFAAAFYQALGFGRDVRTAFDLGCSQIDLENLAEQDTPKLLAFKGDPKQIVFVREE